MADILFLLGQNAGKCRDASLQAQAWIQALASYFQAF